MCEDDGKLPLDAQTAPSGTRRGGAYHTGRRGVLHLGTCAGSPQVRH